jgi:protein TonB
VISQPVIAASPATATAPLDPAAQKKAFEAAVQLKMQEEMMKLQADMNQQLKQQQSKNAPVQTASVIAPQQLSSQQQDDRGSAAALDQRRVAAQPLTQTQAVQQQPVVPQPQTSAVTTPPSVTQAAVSAIREGDVVDVQELDKLPELLSQPRPFYPPLAVQQHAEAVVIVSTLISENGDVTDVKVLRGDARFGFNDSAIRAMRAVRFTPPMKDGKRVKTWRPQTVTFKR